MNTGGFYFLKMNRGEGIYGREEIGIGKGEGEVTVVKMYCMREKSS